MKYLQRHNYSVGPSTEVIGLQIVQKGENKEMARPGLNWPKKSQCHGPASCACWLCAASFPLKTTCDVPGWQIRSSSAQRCAAKIAPIRESGKPTSATWQRVAGRLFLSELDRSTTGERNDQRYCQLLKSLRFVRGSARPSGEALLWGRCVSVCTWGKRLPR